MRGHLLFENSEEAVKELFNAIQKCHNILKVKYSLLGWINIFILISCKKETVIDVPLPNLTLRLYENRELTINSIRLHNLNPIYDNSYPYQYSGLKTYYFYAQNDSLIFFNRIFFLNNKLHGVDLRITSKQLEPDAFFHKIHKNIYLPIHNIISLSMKPITVDTSRYEKNDKNFNFNINIHTEDLNKIILANM